jgi:YHS domain-containing protein
MKVDRQKAVTKEIGDQTYYFCSTHCLHAFEADPGRYRHDSEATEHEHAAHARH